MIRATIEIQSFQQLFDSSWGGARDVLNRVQEAGKMGQAMALIASFCDLAQERTGAPPRAGEINDFVRFDLPDEMNLDELDEE